MTVLMIWNDSSIQFDLEKSKKSTKSAAALMARPGAQAAPRASESGWTQTQTRTWPCQGDSARPGGRGSGPAEPPSRTSS
eukprot:2206560-Rhodomonas_salina.1